MPYTKSQLLTKYDIPAAAFEVLQGGDHFSSPFKAKNGLSVVAPTKEDEFALECARLTTAGFRGAPLLPYHRFLVLRFLCLPVQDVYEELINVGLLASRERFKVSFLEKIFKKLKERAPKEIQKVFDTKEPPGPKAQVSLARFKKFLSIMNIRFFYENPDHVEDLGFFLKSRDVCELILTTSGTNDAIAEFFTQHIKAAIPCDAIVAYRLLYYAAHELSTEDWKSYLATIPPDERKAKTDARGKDLVEYASMKGILGLASMGDMLDRAKMKYIRELSNTQGFQTPAALQAQRSALDSILKIDQYQRELGGDDTDFWKIFERFSVRKPDDDEPLSINDIRPQTDAQESAG